MSAQVMTAKVIWYAQNNTNGIVRANASLPVVASMLFIQAKSKLPMNPPSPKFPNANEKAMVTHRIAIRPMAKKFCISMPSMFLARTIPP
jgi:hypothetical protein